MDTMPGDPPMQNPPPLDGLDPADLLQQGVADDTFVGGEPSSFDPPPIEDLATIFPQFEILELIGHGGMGAVYKVRQKDLDRIVALKILPPASGRSPEFSNRFTREARALAKLNHPGIVTLHEFGQQDGLYFILMEFVDGVNLAQLMKTGRISPREALAIIPQICDALQCAHDQGIVHRDIKPENILLDRLGRVKVADFGIAKVVAAVSDRRIVAAVCDRRTDDELPQPAATADATLAGKIIGTPAYMAPEQIAHPADVDHRADIYALGVVFYQMLTGELPGKRLEAPSTKVHIDVRLDEIVLRAMEQDPELRYQHASVMRTRVDDLGAVPNEVPDAKPTPPPAKTRAAGKMIAIGCGIVALVLFVALAVLAAVWWRSAMRVEARPIAPTPTTTASVNLAEEYVDMELAAAKARASYHEGNSDRVAVENRLKLMLENHPELPNEQSRAVATRWLLMVDDGKYAESYAAASALMHKSVTAKQWEVVLATVRQPLGRMTSRCPQKCQEVKSLPGVPDGEYRLLLFNTSFANKKEAVETVTFVKEEDGVWRAAGYFIR